jgi:energy-coupling factor transport system permease protein
MARLVPRVAAPVIPVAAPRAHVERRATHPWAWWGWAIGAAAAVSLTHNLALIMLVCVAVITVVMARRSDAPWAHSMGIYVGLALVIVVMRLLFQITIGGMRYGRVLFTLPQLELPSWMAGIRIGGPVTLEGLVYTAADAGRLGAMIICLGAANALANPRRALRSVPSALHEVSTALVIALSVAPQLVESLFRIRRARRLRGGSVRGLSAVAGLVVPVLQDAIERSMNLAASMESRGYGSTRDHRRAGRLGGFAMLASLALLGFGAFALLSIPDAALAGAGSLAAGTVAAVIAMRSSGKQLAVTHYRPDPWRAREFVTLAAGLAAVGLAITLGQVAPKVLTPAAQPASWPAFHPLMVAIIAAILAPLAVSTRPGAGES